MSTPVSRCRNKVSLIELRLSLHNKLLPSKWMLHFHNYFIFPQLHLPFCCFLPLHLPFSVYCQSQLNAIYLRYHAEQCRAAVVFSDCLKGTRAFSRAPDSGENHQSTSWFHNIRHQGQKITAVAYHTFRVTYYFRFPDDFHPSWIYLWKSYPFRNEKTEMTK